MFRPTGFRTCEARDCFLGVSGHRSASQKCDFPWGSRCSLTHPFLKGSEYAASKKTRVDLQSKGRTLHEGNFLWLLQRTIKPCCTWCNYPHFYNLLCLNHYYSMLGKASLGSSQSWPLTALFHSLNYESSQRKLQTQALASGQPQPSKHTQLTGGAGLFTHFKWIVLN